MWLDTRRTYVPPPERHRMYSTGGWLSIVLACFAVLAYFIGLTWVGGAFYSLLK